MSNPDRAWDVLVTGFKREPSCGVQFGGQPITGEARTLTLACPLLGPLWARWIAHRVRGGRARSRGRVSARLCRTQPLRYPARVIMGGVQGQFGFDRPITCNSVPPSIS